MDQAAYLALRDLQDRHWWFVGRRAIVGQMIRRFAALPAHANVLEVGCGYGGNLSMLAEFGKLQAFEFDEQARAYAASLGVCSIQSGFLPDGVNLDENSIDLIAMLDVLEHIERDTDSLRKLNQALTLGGSIMITVPAVPWLWSEHDEIHHHRRRYSRLQLTSVLRDAGFELVRVGYFNSLLFPLALIQRLASRFLASAKTVDAMPPTFLNFIFANIFRLEAALLQIMRLPIGLSLYAIARKSN